MGKGNWSEVTPWITIYHGTKDLQAGTGDLKWKTTVPYIISLPENSTSQSMTVWQSIRKVIFHIALENILQSAQCRPLAINPSITDIKKAENGFITGRIIEIPGHQRRLWSFYDGSLGKCGHISLIVRRRMFNKKYLYLQNRMQWGPTEGRESAGEKQFSQNRLERTDQ